jgi:hypothetical protein
MYSNESYIESYKNIDKIDKIDRVIISFTTTHDKIKNIIPVINSLLDQTVKVDLISLVLLDGFDYKIPKNLKNSVTIFKTEQNNGCLTPLLSSLVREGDSTTTIIILGDGIIYGKDFIEILLEESVQHPEKIIYVNNKDSIDPKKGVLFKTKFFDVNFLDITENDDPKKWLNKYFEQHQKKKIRYSENFRAL